MGEWVGLVDLGAGAREGIHLTCQTIEDGGLMQHVFLRVQEYLLGTNRGNGYRQFLFA